MRSERSVDAVEKVRCITYKVSIQVTVARLRRNFDLGTVYLVKQKRHEKLNNIMFCAAVNAGAFRPSLS